MQIATIQSITPTGEPPYMNPAHPEYGPLYPFRVVFTSGFTGIVNAKSAVGPSYRAGSQVGYEITGQHPSGMAKIKVDSKAGQFGAPAVQPAVPQPPPAPAPALPAGTALPPPPQAIGMVVKAAVDIIIHNAKTEPQPVDLPTLRFKVVQIGRELLAAGDDLSKPEKEDVPY